MIIRKPGGKTCRQNPTGPTRKSKDAPTGKFASKQLRKNTSTNVLYALSDKTTNYCANAKFMEVFIINTFPGSSWRSGFLGLLIS